MYIHQYRGSINIQPLGHPSLPGTITRPGTPGSGQDGDLEVTDGGDWTTGGNPPLALGLGSKRVECLDTSALVAVEYYLSSS